MKTHENLVVPNKKPVIIEITVHEKNSKILSAAQRKFRRFEDSGPEKIQANHNYFTIQISFSVVHENNALEGITLPPCELHEKPVKILRTALERPMKIY